MHIFGLTPLDRHGGLEKSVLNNADSSRRSVDEHGDSDLPGNLVPLIS